MEQLNAKLDELMSKYHPERGNSVMAEHPNKVDLETLKVLFDNELDMEDII